jgi:prevent-host-death family protein
MARKADTIVRRSRRRKFKRGTATSAKNAPRDPQSGKRHWKLHDAKARFSELVERARSSGPQWVNRNGKPVVVVVATEEYQKLARDRQRRWPEKLSDFFAQSPFAEVDLDFSREPAEDRPVDL